jgi:hypothetical protein
MIQEGVNQRFVPLVILMFRMGIAKKTGLSKYSYNLIP